MSLGDLFQQVSPLLDVCVNDEILLLRNLRLVCKDCSRIALLGLRSYTVTLKDCPDDTNINGSSLLQHARLKNLTVRLNLSGACSQAILLKAFVQSAGAGLSTVTKLDLQIHKSCDSQVTASLLDDATAVLVNACPATQILRSQGHLSSKLMQSLHTACPLLAALDLSAEEGNIAHTQQVVLLLPTLLPRVTSLGFSRASTAYDLPDMSSNKGIVDLQLKGFDFQSEAHWSFLPPKLQQLLCGFITVGPPASVNITRSLASLVSVTLECSEPDHVEHVGMRAVAQLLRAAQALKAFRSDTGRADFTFVCSPEEDTAVSDASDMSVLRQRFDIAEIRGAYFNFDFASTADVQPFTAALSCMAGVRKLQIDGCTAEHLPSLLNTFFDAQVLLLEVEGSMDDYDLQAVAACKHLERLNLYSCNKVSPMGVVALRQRLPYLSYVGHHACPLMAKPRALARCVKILKGYGLDIEIVCD